MAEPIRLKMEYVGHIVPYVRVGQERWTPRARRYKASQDALAWALKVAAGKAGIPDGGADAQWSVQATFLRSTAAGDLDNLLKAVLDAGNGIVWSDDRSVIHIQAWKHRCKKNQDSVIVTVEQV